MVHRIAVAEPRPYRKVWLKYEDGQEGEVDFGSTIKRGGVFAKLAEPSFFQRVRVGEAGRFLEWPDGIDFCADALRQRLAQGAPVRRSLGKSRSTSARSKA